MNHISMNVVTLLYLVASVCFIQALKGLSSPSSARMGNTFGMAGMAIAVATTIALIFKMQAEFAAASDAARSSGGMGFPLVLLGVVTPAQLRELRGYVVVGIFILAAVITPPDVVSQLMLAIPMCLLYELGILVSSVLRPARAAD